MRVSMYEGLPEKKGVKRRLCTVQGRAAAPICQRRGIPVPWCLHTPPAAPRVFVEGLRGSEAPHRGSAVSTGVVRRWRRWNGRMVAIWSRARARRMGERRREQRGAPIYPSWTQNELAEDRATRPGFPVHLFESSAEHARFRGTCCQQSPR
jgi:hypothetical protein